MDLTAEYGHILLLAGTFEARVLAGKLADTFPDTRLTVSFAGAVSDLPELNAPMRVGGFGGVKGLQSYLASEKVTLILDATHPYAAQMSWNAFTAASHLKVRLIRLDRPHWKPQTGDTWQSVASLEEASRTFPRGARVFLSVGRKDVAAFYRRTDVFVLARMIEPPTLPPPAGWQVLLSRPPKDVFREVQLLRDNEITHVVSKNSGGASSYAKIEAARTLGLPVIMIDRPSLPASETAASSEALMDLLARTFTQAGR